jgi:hypothetical protein
LHPPIRIVPSFFRFVCELVHTYAMELLKTEGLNVK